MLGAAVLALLAAFPTWAEDEGFPGDVAGQDEITGVISVTEETFSLPILDAEQLLHEVPSDVLRHARLREMVAAGKARLERFIVLRTKSGQRAVVEQIHEVRFPTEFDPPHGPVEPKKNLPDLVVPARPLDPFPVDFVTPTAFETRNVGDTLELEPTLGPDGVTIDVNLVPQAVRHVADRVVSERPPMKQPTFECSKVSTSVTLQAGQPFLLATLNAGPANTPGIPAPAELRVRLDFLTADVLRREKVPAKSPGAAAMIGRAQGIQIPKLEFRDVTLSEAVGFLRRKSEELDPDKKGLNFLLKRDPEKAEPRITLSLKDVSLYDATRYVANLATYVVEVEETALLLRPAGGP
jgi:hypothetical protein